MPLRIDPQDLGWIGAMKAAVNALVVLATVGFTLTWPSEFKSAESLVGVFVGAFVVCGFVEWCFRSWHREQADKIAGQAAAIGAAEGARLQGRLETIARFRDLRVLVTSTDAGEVLAATPRVDGGSDGA